MTNQEKIAKLKELGFTVHITHYRYAEEEGWPFNLPELFTPTMMLPERTLRAGNYVLAAKGGETRVKISKGDDLYKIGVATCSKSENFNRRLGLTIALGRAIKEVYV